MASMDVTEFEAAGLYAPAAPEADDRLLLLRHLVGIGASIEEMVAADHKGLLPWVGVDHLLADASQGLSLEEVAERAGIDVNFVDRAQRALGLPAPDDASYDERSITAFAVAASFFGVDPTLQFSRVLGSSLARIVDAANSLFASEVGAQLQARGGSELELARQGEDATRLLLQLPTTIAAVFPAYVKDSIRRLRLTGQEPSGGLRVAVGFVDLVGSTRLAQQLSGRDLAHAVGEFESAAYELALAHDGRVVKFIGDEAMFVAPDPGAVCAIGLGLCDMAGQHGRLTGARGAVGFGEIVTQDGDYYGPVVNMTSRLTSVATAGQLLGTVALRAAVEATSADFVFAPAGAHTLRGFDDPVDVVSIVYRFG
jgi:adenylate cyclase